jgi:hypothetical protein
VFDAHFNFFAFSFFPREKKEHSKQQEKMYYLFLLNLASHFVTAIPFVVLLQKKLFFHATLFFPVYTVVTIHGMMPFQHPEITRKLDNTLACLLFSFLSTFATDNKALEILIPIASTSLYIGIILGTPNADMAAFMIQTFLLTIAGLYHIYSKHAFPKIRDWRIGLLIAMWVLSNFFYLALSDSSYIEVVHRSVSGIVFSLLVLIIK